MKPYYHSIGLLEGLDTVHHFEQGRPVSPDDIRAAVRAEFGRGFSTATLRMADAHPEEWYESGSETWEPEEPEVMRDVDIHRGAIHRARVTEEMKTYGRPALRQRGQNRTPEQLDAYYRRLARLMQ